MSFFVSSSWISLRNLLSITARGAFPGRYPGIFANRAKLFAMASHSFATSSAGNSICSFETEPGCFSTSTFIALSVAALNACRNLPEATVSRGSGGSPRLYLLGNRVRCGSTHCHRPSRFTKTSIARSCVLNSCPMNLPFVRVTDDPVICDKSSDTFEIVLNDCCREGLFEFQKFFFHFAGFHRPPLVFKTQSPRT